MLLYAHLGQCTLVFIIFLRDKVVLKSSFIIIKPEIHMMFYRYFVFRGKPLNVLSRDFNELCSVRGSCLRTPTGNNTFHAGWEVRILTEATHIKGSNPTTTLSSC